MDIKLNKDFGSWTTAHNYKLNPKEKYVIDIGKEAEEQEAIVAAVQMIGLPALRDWHVWLESNGFDSQLPNPTNVFVGAYYGKDPLWQTKYSQGIVVKAENDDDYYIVMECSRLNQGFKYTQIILTLGGCI